MWTITSEQLQLGVILEDLKWDLTAHVELEENDDENLHDLAVVHHLLALNIMKQDNRPPTEPPSCGMEGHVCGTDHCLNTLNEQHCQLDKLYGRLSRSDKSEMELISDCQGVTEVNLMTAVGFYSMVSSFDSLERLERAHELVTSFKVEALPGAL